MKLPRWVHHLYANLNGYFWLPCPLCGKMNGGHEWTNDICIASHHREPERGICDDCATKAKIGFDKDMVIKIDPITRKPFDTGWRTLH